MAHIRSDIRNEAMEFGQFAFKRGDTVIMSSNPIPGNEESISKTINRLLRRGANVICEARGGAYTSDAYHITAPDPSGRGQTLAIKRAIERAELAPTDIDYVAAHATATNIGDIGETKSIKAALGDRALLPQAQVEQRLADAAHLAIGFAVGQLPPGS